MWILKTEDAIETFLIHSGLCGGRFYWAFQRGAENIFSPHNLKRLKAAVYFWRSWSGDETTFLPAILQELRDEHRFRLFSRGVWKILGFNDSKRVENQTFFVYGRIWLIFLTQSSLGDVDVNYEVREPLRDPQSNFELWNTLSELKEARDVPAGWHLATRAKRPVQQYQFRRGRTTERMDSAGSADRRGAVEKDSTTERMTDTTMRTRLRDRAQDRAQPWLRMQPC